MFMLLMLQLKNNLWGSAMMNLVPWITIIQLYMCKDYSGYGISQWETMLHCNVVYHWLSPYQEWALPKGLDV